MPYRGRLWGGDVFGGKNAGLVIAEVELKRAGKDFALPIWVGRESTGESRFTNSRLARVPFPGTDAHAVAFFAKVPLLAST